MNSPVTVSTHINPSRVSLNAQIVMQALTNKQWELGLVGGWLLAVGLFNWYGPIPIVSIFPYLLPVLFVAWRHGLGWSFTLAGIATLAAWPAGYTQNHTQTDLLWAGFTTYGKLTVAAIGFIIGKKIVEHRNPRR